MLWPELQKHSTTRGAVGHEDYVTATSLGESVEAWKMTDGEKLVDKSLTWQK